MKSFHECVEIICSPYETKAYAYNNIGTAPLIPVFYTKHRKPKTLSKSFMCGVNNTNSRFFVRRDGDDTSAQGMPFHFGIELLKNNPKIKAVYPFYRIYKVDPKKYGRIDGPLLRTPQGAGVIYDRKAFTEVGGYNTRIDIQCDLDFWIRFTREHEVAQYPAIYLWFYHGDNRSLDKNCMIYHRRKILHNLFGEDAEMFDKFIPHFGMYAYVD